MAVIPRLEGLQMSQPLNREAAVSCEPEVEQVLSWFKASFLTNLKHSFL